ncbi:MAG: S1/P1 nuclease [Legionellaceae bacterium]|nr:S1/P1 nuclease [Legionellaceae bacterium]
MVTVSRIKCSHALAVLLGVFSPLFAFAWNAEGHRVIAQIAYNHMTPTAKKRFQVAHPTLDKHKKPPSFIEAATWLDNLRNEENSKALGAMHYVDIPFSTDGTHGPKPKSMNGLMAYNQSLALLSANHASSLERVFALRVLMHVAGDLHQPLHAATRVSRKYPEGDAGGNRVDLPKNKIAQNLHAYWDRAGGALLYSVAYERNPEKRARQRARALEEAWPCKPEFVDKDPVHWVAESHDLAVSEAYSITAKNFSSGTYQHTVSRTSEKRLALAGCRLAAALNQLDTQLSHAFL